MLVIVCNFGVGDILKEKKKMQFPIKTVSIVAGLFVCALILTLSFVLPAITDDTKNKKDDSSFASADAVADEKLNDSSVSSDAKENICSLFSGDTKALQNNRSGVFVCSDSDTSQVSKLNFYPDGKMIFENSHGNTENELIAGEYEFDGIKVIVNLQGKKCVFEITDEGLVSKNADEVNP